MTAPLTYKEVPLTKEQDWLPYKYGGGIYKITSPSGNVYIGQATNFRKRIAKYLCGDHKSQPALTNSFNKYETSAHIIEVLEIFPDDPPQDFKNKREQHYIDFYKQLGATLLNCKDVYGYNTFITDEHREKLRQNWTGPNNPSKKPFSKERLIRMSKSMTGKPGYWRGKKAPEHVVELSRQRMVGNTYRRGVPHSDATKQKLSISKKGTKLTENAHKIALITLDRLAKARRKAVRVLDLVTGSEYLFTHAKAAAEFLKMPQYQGIRSVITSKSQLYKKQYKITWL